MAGFHSLTRAALAIAFFGTVRVKCATPAVVVIVWNACLRCGTSFRPPYDSEDESESESE